MLGKTDGAHEIRGAFKSLSSFVHVHLVTQIGDLPPPFAVVFQASDDGWIHLAGRTAAARASPLHKCVSGVIVVPRNRCAGRNFRYHVQHNLSGLELVRP